MTNRERASMAEESLSEILEEYGVEVESDKFREQVIDIIEESINLACEQAKEDKLDEPFKIIDQE